VGNVFGKGDKRAREQTRFAKKTSARVKNQMLSAVKTEGVAENDTN
jgi:hypothetical protein